LVACSAPEQRLRLGILQPHAVLVHLYIEVGHLAAASVAQKQLEVRARTSGLACRPWATAAKHGARAPDRAKARTGRGELELVCSFVGGHWVIIITVVD